MGKAVKAGIVSVQMVNLRDYTDDPYRSCDDYPYGGGSGMVIKPEPLFRALGEHAGKATVVLTTPGGRLLDQGLVKTLSQKDDICILCGHYEGVDERVVEKYVDLEISIGDYILSGGEYAALVIMDAVVRYVPGFMSNPESLKEESFESHLLEYPQYTRPADLEGYGVPEVLLSGDHARIEKWRYLKSVEKTRRLRPDLYKRHLIRKIEGEEP